MARRAVAAPWRALLVAALVMTVGFLLAFADPASGVAKQASLSIFDDDDGRALFPSLVMAPGHTYQECLLVGATADSADNTVQVGVSGVIGDLAEHLLLTVEAGSGGRFGDCSGFSGTPVYTGTLAGLAATDQGYGVTTDWRPAEVPQRAYRISVALDQTVSDQELRAEGRFVWRLTGPTVDPPPDPTTGPSTEPSPTSSPTSSPPGRPSTTPRPSPEPPGVSPGPAGSTAPGPSPRVPRIVLRQPAAPTGPVESPDLTIGEGIAWVADVVRRAQRAAVAVAAEPQYPVMAVLLALVFLMIQDQIDRRDPKLAGVARQRDNEADFPDRFGGWHR